MIESARPLPDVARHLADGIDPGSPVPLYYQLAVAIEQAIDRGDLPAGSRLDNELDLARSLALSRPTVRQALGYLVDRGRLVRRRGIGTIVLPAAVRRPVGLTSLFDDLVRSGRRPATRVLALEVTGCPGEPAQTLDVEPGSPVTHVRRLRLVDDEPLAVMENYLPPPLVEVDHRQLEQTGLYRLLAASGIVPRIASQSVTARPAGSEEARLLHVSPGAPLLALRRISYDATGRAIEFASHAYVGERYAIEMSLMSDER
ncbi:MAG: GntR family transcriptional regulator [Candidatus Dormibacteraeota bacterium]|nr:GntR family transcriptional regulator [Candidatus Dormibacteraeota bacterium]MBO0743782.1 GntR family transcriptional regulator [Candidatus Dormibacteraeota bacterium]